jgi:chorismate dehydratase
MPGLRISAISFLNTAPLMWDFEHGDAGRDFEISYTLPSACAAALAAGQADIGIIPAFTYAQIPELVILPNIAIAAKDRVRSILLVSKKPIGDVRTVAADTSSRTSVALLQVLFAKFFGGARELTPHPPKLDEMLQNHDAALLIGDAALQVPLDAGYHLYDLAHLWHRATGKPFVFAFWAVRLDALNRQPAGMNLGEGLSSSPATTGSNRTALMSSLASGLRSWDSVRTTFAAISRKISTIIWTARITPASISSCNIPTRSD